MIGQTAVKELTKKSPLLFTIHQNIFINIFPFYFYYFDGISLEVFYAYWKVIGFAIPSTIAALSTVIFPAISLSYHRQFHFDQSPKKHHELQNIVVLIKVDGKNNVRFLGN